MPTRVVKVGLSVSLSVLNVLVKRGSSGSVYRIRKENGSKLSTKMSFHLKKKFNATKMARYSQNGMHHNAYFG